MSPFIYLFNLMWLFVVMIVDERWWLKQLKIIKHNDNGIFFTSHPIFFREQASCSTLPPENIQESTIFYFLFLFINRKKGERGIRIPRMCLFAKQNLNALNLTILKQSTPNSTTVSISSKYKLWVISILRWDSQSPIY